MTLSPATRVRNWRDRKRKAGLVHLDKWVPADKLSMQEAVGIVAGLAKEIRV